MLRVPLPKRILLGCFKELKSFYDWYKEQVEKDPNYGKKRKPRKHK
jgi:hypothetical protein